MKITHNKVGQNLNLRDTKDAQSSAQAEGASANKMGDVANKDLSVFGRGSDSSRVVLSERAQELKKAKELALSAPDIREDKVAQLQKLIDDGKYNVGAKDIADRMVDEEAQWL
jgi:negative regulator of flagellin synthesis FlgM